MVRKAMTAAALAAVSAEEARQLGTTLTAVGAEKAGNKEGTIPEYTGGLTAPPAAFEKGSGMRPSPFAAEKPRLVIDGKNMAQHADKLSVGVQELLKRYPSMRLDVYPTHRTVGFPKKILDNTVKNATAAKTVDGGVGIENMVPGYPFPIPKSGNEAIWNHNMRYSGTAVIFKYDSYNVDAAGVATLSTSGELTNDYPLFDPKRPDAVVKETEPYLKLKVNYFGPARRVGEAVIAIDFVNPLKHGRRAYQYLPGQRRVKLAPDLAYDTPNPGTAGTSTYDDVFMYNGAQDRYDYKLVGRKEMYVPYNGYKLTYTPALKEAATPKHVNPDFMRWELHRVWVVEATLKPDKRHIYHKRVFYLDEDSWVILLVDQYDAKGQLYRASLGNMTYSYDVQAVSIETYMFHDFATGAYTLVTGFGPYYGLKYIDQRSDVWWAPESLAGTGLR